LDDLTLTGQYYHGQSKLNCRVENNTKYDTYTLEFSSDGIRFNEVQRTINTSLNSHAVYSFTHEISSPKMFYRIAGKDKQGKIDYSNIILLRTTDKQQLIRVYPNPVQNYQIQVELFERTNQMV